MKYILQRVMVVVAVLTMSAAAAMAQESDNKEQKAATDTLTFDKSAPMMEYKGEPKLYRIRKVNVHGVEHLDHDHLRAAAGLIPGDSLYLPSSYISYSISRLWSQRYFSDVQIGASIEGDSIDLDIMLQERPRVYQWHIVGEGIGRSKQKDLMEKLNLKRGSELSDYIIDRSERLIKKDYESKGFRNVEVTTTIENDTMIQNAVNVTFNVKKNQKVKVGKITFDGNEQFDDKRLRKTFKKTRQKSWNIFKSSKFNAEEYKEDKNLLVDFYNSRGYRNATVVSDSIYNISENRIGIHLNVTEGEKFYIRDVKWVGNSVYETDQLQRMFTSVWVWAAKWTPSSSRWPASTRTTVT